MLSWRARWHPMIRTYHEVIVHDRTICVLPSIACWTYEMATSPVPKSISAGFPLFWRSSQNPPADFSSSSSWEDTNDGGQSHNCICCSMYSSLTCFKDAALSCTQFEMVTNHTFSKYSRRVREPLYSAIGKPDEKIYQNWNDIQYLYCFPIIVYQGHYLLMSNVNRQFHKATEVMLDPLYLDSFHQLIG